MITLYNLGVYSTIDEAFDKINGNKHIEVYSINQTKYKEYQRKQNEINELYRKIYSA